jgi:hypothetical protein
MIGFALKLLSGVAGRIGANPVSAIIQYGRQFYSIFAGIIGLAWYTSWRKQLQGLAPNAVPIPGLSKLQKNPSLLRSSDPELPTGPIPTTADVERGSTALGGNTSLSNAATAGMPLTGTAPDGGGLLTYDGKVVAAWIVPILKYARTRGWRGHVTSGYRSAGDQARIDAGPHYGGNTTHSEHMLAKFPDGAVDVSDYQTLAIVLSRSPYRGVLVWAGGKDVVHFSHPHNGGY